MGTLEHELTNLLNSFSAETSSDTPDFVLARYLLSCLNAYCVAVNQCREWNMSCDSDNAHHVA